MDDRAAARACAAGSVHDHFTIANLRNDNDQFIIGLHLRSLLSLGRLTVQKKVHRSGAAQTADRDGDGDAAVRQIDLHFS